jgi:hypothetical protein
MHSYSIVLFIHLLALLLAFGASSLVHYAMVRMRDAESAGDALSWLGLCHRASRAFPVALVTLVASGAWLVHKAWTWHAGFVDAGLVGAVLLLVLGGAVEGGRARKIAAALAADPGGAVGEVVRDPLLWAVNWANTGIALGVVFAMVTKPAAGGSFAAVAVGLAAGACVGLAFLRRRADARVPGEVRA